MSDQTIPIVGTLTRSADGSFTLTLKGNAGTTPIPPNPTDPRPVKTFVATGGDDTAAVQAWLNSQTNDVIYEVQGLAGINSKGITLSNRSKVTVRAAANGGGFRAISNGVYATPYSSKIYGVSLTDCSFENLKLDCNNKQAQALFVHKSTRPKILSCEAWGVAANPNGAPFGALKADLCNEPEFGFCNVHDTGGIAGGEGVRGIYAGTGGEFCTKPYIHDCIVRNTGHTGIATESSQPRVVNNQVSNILINGTGYKFIARGAVADAIFDNNRVDTTMGGGIMIEGSDVDPTNIFLRGWTAINCGAQGTTFGFLYVSGSRGVRNLQIDGVQLDNCRSIGAAQYLTDSIFRNITIKNGPDQFHYELNCNNIRQDQAGKADIGQNVTNVWVDGQKVA